MNEHSNAENDRLLPNRDAATRYDVREANDLLDVALFQFAMYQGQLIWHRGMKVGQA